MSATFSSRELPVAQQYERFREAVSATHLAWDMAARRGEFRATIAGRSLASAAVVACACDPCRGRRGRPELARTAAASFGVLCVLAGRERVTQGRGAVELRAGSFALWDASEPLTFEVPDALEKLTLLVPEALIPDAREHLGVAFDATDGCGALFVAHLRALAGLAGELSPAGQEVALRTALELLAVAVEGPAIGARAGELVARVVRHARARLAEPSLDASSIAAAVGVSRRQVDRAFAATGRSITRWIWRERALCCRRDLVLAPRTSLTDIAARWGFCDAAHFSRVFRREFGVTPREHRSRGLARD